MSLRENKDIAPYIILTDKIISHDACDTRRRPDVLISSGGLHIVAECDEKQHWRYSAICESGRMDEIIDELKEGKVVFIRWNPDSYTIGKKQKRLTRKERLTRLNEVILDIASGKKILDNPITVLYMFYDEHNPVIANRWAKEFIW